MWWFSIGIADITNIASIERTYGIAPGTVSLKSLCIDFKPKRGMEYPSWICLCPEWICVSPVREKEFIETLKAINPNIRVDVSDKKGIWRILGWDI